MTELIVAAFENVADADAAERNLEAGGIPSRSIRRYQPGEIGAPKIHPATIENTSTISALSPSEKSESHGGFWNWLFGDETDHQHHYAADRSFETDVSVGRTIISVQTDNDAQSVAVMDILERHRAAEIETQPQAASPSMTDEATRRTTTDTPTGLTEPTASTTEQVIPLSEEHLAVGKRKVDLGTTRIQRYVLDRPAEAAVNLRDETVEIERRKPAAGAMAGDFEERTVEVQHTREEPVVSKVANVAEEVVIKKDAAERTETVRDTVRREEVDVDKSTGATRE